MGSNGGTHKYTNLLHDQHAMGHGFGVCQVDLVQILHHQRQGGEATTTLAWWNEIMTFFARIVGKCVYGV